jgi:hypothetical protein
MNTETFAYCPRNLLGRSLSLEWDSAHYKWLKVTDSATGASVKFNVDGKVITQDGPLDIAESGEALKAVVGISLVELCATLFAGNMDLQKQLDQAKRGAR